MTEEQMSGTPLPPEDSIEATTAESVHGKGGFLRRVNKWRRSRPFWGSLILLLGGYYVMNPVMTTNMEMLVALGSSGAVVFVLGGAMMAAALIAFFLPKQRHFPAIMAAAASVLSLPLANLGGWLIGMILGIIGSGMVFAWTPYSDKQLAHFAERDAKKAERKQAKRAQG